MIAAYHVEGANDWPAGVEEEGATRADVKERTTALSKEGTTDFPNEGTTDLIEEGTTDLPNEGRNGQYAFQAISTEDVERMPASRNTQESSSGRILTGR